MNVITRLLCRIAADNNKLRETFFEKMNFAAEYHKMIGGTVEEAGGFAVNQHFCCERSYVIHFNTIEFSDQQLFNRLKLSDTIDATERLRAHTLHNSIPF